MTSIDKIRKLYNLSNNKFYGFSEIEIDELENNLGFKLPLQLKNYYLTLGNVPSVNYSHNRLLKPNGEIRFSKDRYLIFYEENQNVVYWGIKEEDLNNTNPPVWGNSGTDESPNWYVETNSTDNFFLLMAVYNGTFGGLGYNANYLGSINPELVNLIKSTWTKVEEISWEGQKVYTNNFDEIISLSFDEQASCYGIFIGTSHKDKFDKMLNNININWSYISYEDEIFEDEL